MKINNRSVVGVFTTRTASPESAASAFVRLFALSVRQISRLTGVQPRILNNVLVGAPKSNRARVGSSALCRLYGLDRVLLLEGAKHCAWRFEVTEDRILATPCVEA